jgi:hypothetical protein
MRLSAPCCTPLYHEHTLVRLPVYAFFLSTPMQVSTPCLLEIPRHSLVQSVLALSVDAPSICEQPSHMCIASQPPRRSAQLAGWQLQGTGWCSRPWCEHMDMPITCQ